MNNNIERDFVYDSILDVIGMDFVCDNNTNVVIKDKNKAFKECVGYIDETPWPKLKKKNPRKILILKHDFLKDLEFSTSDDVNILSKKKSVELNYEICFLDEEYKKTLAYFKTNKPKRFVTKPNNADTFFQVHYKFLSANKENKQYIKGMGVCNNTIAYPIYPSNIFFKNSLNKGTFDEHKEMLPLFSSVIDNLISLWSIELKYNDKSYIFAANEDFIKDICILRDNPISIKSGKRNPILYICSNHIRRYKSGNSAKIKKQIRGCYNFYFDDYEIIVSPPIKEILETNKFEKFENHFPCEVWKKITSKP